MTDCISMDRMRGRSIAAVLTSDRHSSHGPGPLRASPASEGRSDPIEATDRHALPSVQRPATRPDRSAASASPAAVLQGPHLDVCLDDESLPVKVFRD